MKKKIIIILLILSIVVSAAVVYLNKVVLPTKVKSLIVSRLAEATQKKVSLQALKFNIFKGLVLKNLVLSDQTETLLSIKEASCTFLLLPILQKKFVVPTVRIDSPEILLVRQANHRFNLMDLFPAKPAKQSRARFSILVYKISINDGRINFRDDTLSPVFKKSMEDLDLNLNFLFPSSLKFELQSRIAAHPQIKISAKGKFTLSERQLNAQIELKDFSPREFLGYYQNLGISIPEGIIDTTIELGFKDDTIKADLIAQNKGILLSKDKVTAKLNAQVDAYLIYRLIEREFNYSGKAVISKLDLSGLEFVERISNIKGEVRFDNSGLSADKLSADILGLPIESNVNLNDFSNPLLNIDITSSLDISSVQKILKAKLNLDLPLDVQGVANLFLGIKTKLPLVGVPKISGYLDIVNAALKSNKINFPVEDIKGRIEFNQNWLKWSELHFKFFDIPYTTNGTLVDFKAPKASLALSSGELSMESEIAYQDKLIKLSRCNGRYINSDFSLQGFVDTKDIPDLKANIDGILDIDLKDTKLLLKEFKDQIEKINPDGSVQVKFNLNGKLNEPKSCAVRAVFSSNYVSLYGLKSSGFILNYNQANRIVDIPFMRLSLYDGVIEAAAGMNLDSKNLPYWLNVNIQGVKIERLKLDTPIKDKALAGTVTGEVKINGFSDDISKLSGAGKIFITNGNLWQLNLFRGLGELIFAKDFANVVFSQGSCGFIIQDKFISSDNFKLKSNLVELFGPFKIGFDSSIDAELNLEVLDESAPLTGTLKDVLTTIIGQAGRFGIIKISGTIKEPKYKFQPAVVDIIKGLKDTIF